MRKLFLILMAVIACSWSAMAQSRTIKGTVVDAANDEPLIGATVMPIGGGNGTATDIDGNFTLSNLPANVKKAKVSYVGYKTLEVTLTPGMKVRLESTSTSLDDVVVVAYGTANKESLTGSVAVIGSKEIEERPVTSVTAALEGNAPGVQVNNSVGTPGGAPDIRIRGFNSINGTSSPLYVVDGVIFNGSIADLNPNDIESMSVLKDAASAALFGAKGANGVILITTKKAKNVGKVDVTLNISQGMYTLGLPQYERMKANEWMQTAFTGYVNGNVRFNSMEEAIAGNIREQFMLEYAQNNIYGKDPNELFNEQGEFVGGNPLPGYTDLDWWDAVSRTGYRQEYGVNAAAAGEKYNVFASMGYLKENGYTIKSDFERFNGRINANFNPTSYFRMGVNLAATHQESNYDISSSGTTDDLFNVLSMAPIYPYYAHNADGSIKMDENGNPQWNIGSYLSMSNPPYTTRLNDGVNSATVVDANVYGTAVIPYGFEFTVRGAMHRDKTHAWNYNNNVWGSYQGRGGLSEAFYDYRNHQFMQSLTWTHDYGDHHVDVLANHENSELKQSGSSVFNMDQIFDNMMTLNNFSTNQSTGGSAVMVRSERYLGRVRYNYDQKYFGELSLTREGSSRFSKDNRWGTFWSVGGSWIISKEKFMHGLTWIDYLKLRASYGSVGNDASASAYAYWGLYGYGMSYGINSGLLPLVPTQLAANNIKWEATKTFDIALEGSVLQDRLSFTVGYFDKRNADLLMSVTQPASVGSLGYSGYNASVMTNVGTMSNRGWEINVTGTLMRTRDIYWTVSADATFLKNKIVTLPFHEDIDLGSSNRILSEGHSLYEFYGYHFAGVDQLTGQSLYDINPNAHEYRLSDGTQDVATYEETVAAAEKDGSLVVINGKNYTTNINYASKDFNGTSIPTVYGSFGTNFSWKGLNIGMLFTYSLGGQTMDNVYAGYMSFGNSASALHVDLAKSWTAAPEGMTADSPNRIDPNGIPELNANKSINNNAAGSSRWLTSSNYLVFKNLNISYDLPQKWVRPLQLQNIILGISCDNLFTVTARKGMNPQQSWSGGQSMNYGTARVMTFQLTAKF